MGKNTKKKNGKKKNIQKRENGTGSETIPANPKHDRTGNQF